MACVGIFLVLGVEGFGVVILTNIILFVSVIPICFGHVRHGVCLPWNHNMFLST